jgi:hypothetical protein
LSAELELQIAASNCDAYENEGSGAMYLDADRLYMSSATVAGSRSWGGLRFVGEGLPPKGSIIETAYIELNIETTSLDDANGKIYFEKSASPAVFTAAAGDITSRSRTTAYTSWVQNSIGSGWNSSPSLVTALQELIDAYDVDAIVVILKPNSDTVKSLAARQWDYSTHTLGAKLHIIYTPPITAPQVQTDAADNVAQTQAKLHGTLTDDGTEPCDVWFEYGVKPDLTEETEHQEGKVTDETFEQLIADLQPDTPYVFRAVAENSAGPAYGETLEFTTLPIPPPPPVTQKVLITHPALKDVIVEYEGVEQAGYRNLSNLDEKRIEDAIELPVPTPATIKVTTLAGETWIYPIS